MASFVYLLELMLISLVFSLVRLILDKVAVFSIRIFQDTELGFTFLKLSFTV